MKCIHHTDHDGHCAGFWVKKRYPQMTKEDFIEMDYGSTLDWFSKIKKDEPVIIVDFSFDKKEDMDKLLSKTKNVIWIDHHISAIKKFEGMDIKGLRYNGIAGCMLTWAYFNKMEDGTIPFDPKMCTEAPWMTKYVHDRDVWLHEYGEETDHFNLGLDAIPNKQPYDPIWEEALNIDKVRKLIEEGSVIERYRDSLGLRAQKSGFEYDFDGHKAFCINNCFSGSEYFGEMIDKYDIVCCFNYNGVDRIWEYSLYSNKENVDCSVICTERGGGGHKGAAGFTTNKLVFGV